MFKWLIRNLRTFGLALLLAIAVWISAVTAADPDEVRTYPRVVPLEIIGQDPRLVIVGSLPERVNVTLRAPRSTWEQLTANDGQVRAILDLSGLDAGQHALDVQLQVKVQPVRVISVTPQKLDVSLETLATKTITVELAIRGEPAIGYEAERPVISPREITLSGPQSKVEQVTRVITDLNIAGVRQDVQSSLVPRILDSNGLLVNGLTVNPENIQVSVPVTQQGGYRDIVVKVNVRGQVADGYRLTNVSVFPPVLTVYSPNPALVNELPGIVETEPLNLNGAMEDIDTRLALVLPQGVTVVGDQTVQVTVGIETIEGSLSLSAIPVEIIGLNPEYNAQISPVTLDVILTGPLPVLDKLTIGDVRFVVDLSGLPLGTHQVTPVAQILISEIKVQSLNPSAVEVIIQEGPAPTPSPTP